MSIFKRKSPSLKEHRAQLTKVERRLFLKHSLSLGAMSLLTGCNLEDNDTVDRVLWAMSHWNDEVHHHKIAQYLVRDEKKWGKKATTAGTVT